MTADGPHRQLSAPAFLQLAGHPLRWRLLEELARSDRTVQELTSRLGEAQNLVSYHLGKLRAEGLVATRRSSADGRDAFYTADLGRIGDLFSAAACDLHPGLVGSVRPRTEVPPAGATVLFLCTGNSARSQMAEALARARSGGRVLARSAGSRPKPLHRNAVRVMRDEHGIDLAGHEPKHLEVFADERFDRVISLCDRVREVCPPFPGDPETAHWSIPDPAAGEGDDDETYPLFRTIAAELDTRVGFLLSSLGTRAPAP